MDTYTTGRSRVGHYRKPGSHLTYCGRTAGTLGTSTRMCRACVKAEALDRAAATATAEAWLDQAPTSPLMAAALIFGGHVEAVDNRRIPDQVEAAGTWRAEWISARATSTAPTLFDVEPEAEQGALFA
ncbi:hypothetical protein OG864_29795 [Streptomyces sp. NBC_00124]|uniref:hypothetical protein n=1 Tax=Streptomyces sp. NBC_00124 TaxID=2975662 RepID=UPI00225BAE1B|nr:hypothetical protein [Streptomyces sp. NBC_00124]MCX5362895.1 hypothetical protein [Streptomyces sp. NBC_00124]